MRISDWSSDVCSSDLNASDHAHAAQADMARKADDDVVVDRDAELLRGVGDLAGHVDVGARRRRVAARAVVDEDEGGGAEFAGALHPPISRASWRERVCQ